MLNLMLMPLLLSLAHDHVKLRPLEALPIEEPIARQEDGHDTQYGANIVHVVRADWQCDWEAEEDVRDEYEND